MSEQSKSRRFSDSQIRRLSSYGSSTSSPISSPKFTRFDPNAFNTGQSLASVLNNPRSGKNGIYGNETIWTWLMQSNQDVQTETLPPIAPELEVSDVSKADFAPYLDEINEIYSRYLDIREHATSQGVKRSSQSNPTETETKPDKVSGIHGEGLLVCLREIPPLYFSEDFSLENGETFRAACPQTSIPASMMLQEKLSHYLDMVEVHLVKEISSRSDSFFEALEQLELLNNRMQSACDQIRSLKSTVGILEEDLVGAATTIQISHTRRSNLLTLHQKLKTVAYVNDALSTLRLLVSSADCAGALDVIDDLRKLMDSNELIGLHCFRNLNQQLGLHIDTVNSILSSEFIRESLYNGTDLENRNIISSFNLKKKNNFFSLKIIQIQENVKKQISEEAINLKDALLPTIIGLIRTAKLPTVLRSYRDSLISELKFVIKTVVSELINTLLTQTNENSASSSSASSSASSSSVSSSASSSAPAANALSAAAGEVDGVNASLASKLRDISSESFLQLLTFVFEIIQVRIEKALLVKNIIESVIFGVNDSYEAKAIAMAVESAAEKLKEDERSKLEKKDMSVDELINANKHTNEQISNNSLHEVHDSVSLTSPSSSSSTLTSAIPSSSTSLSSSNLSQMFRSDVLKENTETISIACETFQNRWSKILSVRSLTHSKLALSDYVDTFNLTNDFIHITEKTGERLGYSIRGLLQSQTKSFIDSQHNSRMTQLITYLEKETWTAIDASSEFQLILENLCNEKPYHPYKSIKNKVNDKVNDEVNSTVDSISSTFDSVHENERDNERERKEGDGVEGRKEDEGVEEKKEDLKDEENKSEERKGEKKEEKANASSDDVEKIENEKEKEKVKERKNSKSKSSSVQTLNLHGHNFPLGSSALALLKMLEDYLEIAFYLPSMSTEVINKIIEILKIYNSRTCQLVLGAGAMQVSGLKSITAKHLALSSQCVSFVYSLIHDLRKVLGNFIPESRKTIFLVEIDRLAQDYKVHRDEIHSKLVGIMKERLVLRLRSLPTSPEAWNKPDLEGEGEGEVQVGAFARDLTKEVGVLHRVLSPLLLEEDLKSIFTRVVSLFHVLLTEAFSKIDITTPQAKRKLVRDVIHILQCLKGLPSFEVGEKQKELDKFLLTKLEFN